VFMNKYDKVLDVSSFTIL